MFASGHYVVILQWTHGEAKKLPTNSDLPLY